MFGVEMLRDDFVVRRICNRFTDPEQESRGEKHREAASQARAESCQRPNQNTECQQTIDVEPIDEPTGENLAEGVCPEKCGEQNAELRWREMQILLEERCGDRECAAVFLK